MTSSTLKKEIIKIITDYEENFNSKNIEIIKSRKYNAFIEGITVSCGSLKEYIENINDNFYNVTGFRTKVLNSIDKILNDYILKNKPYLNNSKFQSKAEKQYIDGVLIACSEVWKYVKKIDINKEASA